MTTLSSAAWAAHDVGLATAIGGTLFGRTALEPALDDITSPQERDQVSADAWQRFSLVNLLAHGIVAGTWFFGRSMLSGREATKTARSLTKVKDGLVVVSVISGVASVLLGRKLGRRARDGAGVEASRERAYIHEDAQKSQKLQRTVGGLGIINLLTNISILGITSVLAMESSKSVKFPGWAKRLP